MPIEDAEKCLQTTLPVDLYQMLDQNVGVHVINPVFSYKNFKNILMSLYVFIYLYASTDI